MKIRRYRSSMAGGVGRWMVFILALAGLSFYLLKQRSEWVNPYTPGATPTPAPISEPPSAPAIPAEASPTVSAPTPEPIPEATPEVTPTPEAISTPEPPPDSAAAATPEATPTPETALDFATIAATPALWPKQVSLLQKAAFPLVFSGKVVGQAQAPVGTLLQVLRVLPDAAKPQVEVLFQNNRQIIAAPLTDLIPRATALRKAATSQPILPAAAAAQPTPAPVPAQTAMHGVKFSDRVTAEIVRKKQSIATDDYDDKRDDVSMKIKLANSDVAVAFEKHRGTIYILAENLTSSNMVKVIGSESFEFSLPARGNFEMTTEQVTSGSYDQAHDSSRYGHRYIGWFIRIVDSSGTAVMEKATTPSILKMADQIMNTRTGQEFNRNAKRKP